MRRISDVTRRDIVDAVTVEGVSVFGRLGEVDFLHRLFDLDNLPSKDARFENATGDIWQHRINNEDWDDDWFYHDDRLSLMAGDDEVFLRFLCETIHPVVRSDATECERICQLYNHYLSNDGYELVVKARMSGKPVFSGRYIGTGTIPGVAMAKEILMEADTGYVAQQITRMEAAVNNDPDLAIGTAKELIETCCRTILDARGVETPRGIDLPRLVKLTSKELELTPADIPDKSKAADTIKRLLSNLATITNGVAELRNSYGTGHGKDSRARGLSPRHARLAVGAASTLAMFLAETHYARQKAPDE